MELLQLKYFCDAAECENFSKTADKFRVPPSNISQSVKRLESELGALLFERQANSISLTAKGRDFYEKASEALSLLEEGKAIVGADAGVGHIRIFAGSVRRIVMQTVEKFRRTYPDVEIELDYDTHADVKNFDVVISSDDRSAVFGEGIPILRERMLLALNKNHRLAKSDALSINDLKNESFICMGKDSSLSHVFEQLCASAGFVPNVSIRCDDPYYARKCVELSLGIIVFPEISWRGMFSVDTVIRNFGEHTRNTYIYINKKKSVPSVVRSFVAMMKNECEAEEVAL